MLGVIQEICGGDTSQEVRTRCKSPQEESTQHLEDLKNGKEDGGRAAWGQIRQHLVNQIQEAGSRE